MWYYLQYIIRRSSMHASCIFWASLCRNLGYMEAFCMAAFCTKAFCMGAFCCYVVCIKMTCIYERHLHGRLVISKLAALKHSVYGIASVYGSLIIYIYIYIYGRLLHMEAFCISEPDILIEAFCTGAFCVWKPSVWKPRIYRRIHFVLFPALG